MAAVAQQGLSVPSPIPSQEGHLLQTIDGIRSDVLTWLSGKTLDTVLPGMSADRRIEVFQTLGSQMAKLHTASDNWPGFATCDRPAWDRAGLVGTKPLWDRFWENPGLTTTQRDLLSSFRDRANTDLASKAASLDDGLIHADLVTANVMIDGSAMHFIDFDDGGFGFRLFDLATALLKHRDASDYPALKSALTDGYQAQRPIDISDLDLFLTLRAATYVGWNITRAHEDRTGARNARFIETATELAASYLSA